MQLYEIRLLRDDRKCTKFVIAQMHLDDHAAVNAGAKLAQGTPYEVWRELECVFGVISGHSNMAS